MRIGVWFSGVATVAVSCTFAACAAQTSTATGALPPARAPLAVHKLPQHIAVARFDDPYGVATDPRCHSNCEIYVADPGARKVWAVKPNGSKVSVGDFSSLGSDFDPQAVAVSPIDGSVYVADKGTSLSGSRVWRVAGQTSERVYGFKFEDTYARGIAVGPHDEIYTSTVGWSAFASGWVQCSGHCWTYGGVIPFGNSYGIAVDAYENLYIAATHHKAIIWNIPPQTAFPNTLRVGDPYDIATSWKSHEVVIADPGNKRVWRLLPDGTLVDLGGFVDPYGVAVDNEGYAYVADAGAKEVFKVKL